MQRSDYHSTDPTSDLIFDLNRTNKNDDAGTPFGPTVIVKDPVRGGVWHLDAHDKDGFGFWYRSTWECVRRWNIEITHHNGIEFCCIPIS